MNVFFFFFSSRRRHTRWPRDWSSDVCSSDLAIREGYETFWAITEPSGGSDPAGAIRTRAERRGDRWVLNGRKVFISRAHDAPWGVVFARTDPTKGRAGISCFIVERGTPGFTARPIRT